MRLITCIVMIQIFFMNIVHALDIQLTNPPGDYNVYTWSGSSVKHAGLMTKNVNGYSFSIPDQYVIKRSGVVDLPATLRKWRKDTPAAAGNPRTKNGIGYYPFTDANGKQYYMALEYLNERIGRYQGAAITAGGAQVAETPSDEKPKPPAAQVVVQGGDDSSEVVGGADTQEVVEVDPESNVTYDLTGCRYGRVCWGNVSFANKIKKIITNVNHINSLHDAKLNPRYLLCTGYRESTFNPGARGGVGEKGMFQVRPSTGKAALRYGPKLPGFKDMSSSQYMEKMANSTLAQTELSFLTLKMKVKEGVTSRVLEGTGSVADYKALAKRYNGTGAKAERYARAISSCYSCLLTAMPSTSSFSESKVKACLNKAKH